MLQLFIADKNRRFKYCFKIVRQ